jgi:hypothetical protein
MKLACSFALLLRLCDEAGIINDMEETMFHIEEASALPLSILIVGVGDADFTNMDLLCKQPNVKVHAITPPSTYSASKLTRAVVTFARQFIAMAEYTEQPLSELSAELLKDVPQQVSRSAVRNRLTLR